MKTGKLVAFGIGAVSLTIFLSLGICSAEGQSKGQNTEIAKGNELEDQHPFTSEYHRKDDFVDMKSDPKVIFQKAIEKNDMRFAAILVGGYAPYEEVPGLDEKAKNDRLQEKYGTKIIADISGDVIDEDWHKRQELKEPAQKYAEEYNQLLLAKIRLQNN